MLFFFFSKKNRIMAFKRATVALCFLLVFVAGMAEAKRGFYHQTPDTVVGIDMGTTYSRVAVQKQGKFHVITNEQGKRAFTPSYVAFTDTEFLIGEAAKNQAASNPERTIFDFKRLLGRKFDDPEVQRDMKMLPYKVVEKDEKPYVEVKVKGESKVFSPEEISAIIIRKMKEMAESYLGENVTSAVITVPAYFNEAQRHAMKEAAGMAGLYVERIMNEPTAAAMAQGLLKSYGHSIKNVLVFDLGGGTLDTSIVAVEHGISFKLLATRSDTRLGGNDLDRRLTAHLTKRIQEKHKVDITKDKEALGKLVRECERAKLGLSSRDRVWVEIAFQGFNFSEEVTRVRFEELNADLFEMMLGSVERVVEDSHLKKSDIDTIVLSGGSAKIPRVRELMMEFFEGKEPCGEVDLEEAVAHGAAVQGRILVPPPILYPKLDYSTVL